MTTTLRQPSFLRVMLLLAATVVVLVGLHLAAPILNPILFVAVTFDTFPETRCLASLIGVSSPDTGAPESDEEVERTG